MSTAKDIMSTELITVRPEASIEETLRALVNNKVTGLPVVKPGGEMVGVISEYDLLVQISKSGKLEDKVFKEKIIFSTEVKTVRETATLEEIAPMFIDLKFRRLPVVDEKGKLLGIITRRDMMRIYYYRAKLQ